MKNNTNVDIQYKKHNAYIKIFQVKQQLSLQQHRIFDTLIILLQKTKKYTLEDIQKEKEIVFKLSDFKHYLMSNLKTNKINREELKDAVEELVKITLAFDVQTDNKDEIEFHSIFQYAKTDFKNDEIKFIFSKKFSADYMLPTSQYTLLSANYINRLKKTHSRLMYQHFKMLIGKNNFRNNIRLSPDFIRNLLGIQELKAYKINSQITNKIIIPSLEEINQETDIQIEFSMEKIGRNISSYYFKFVNKKREAKETFQQSLIDEDDVYNPELFDDNTLEVEIMEPIEKEKSGVEQTKESFENSEDFREYMILNHIGKVMPKITMPSGDVIEVRINDEGLLTYASKKTILTTPLAKYVWSTLFFMQEKILNNEGLLRQTRLSPDINIFDIYEAEITPKNILENKEEDFF